MKNQTPCRTMAVVSVFSLLCTASPLLAQKAALPATALTRLESAANRRDVSFLKQMTAAGIANDYDWASAAPSMIGARPPWLVKILALPGADQGESSHFVAFTRYQNAESSTDHLYRIKLTDDGPKLGQEIPETDLLGTRVRHHRFTVKLDIPQKHATLTDHVTIERLSTDFPALMLRINAIYTVTAIKRNGTPVPFRQAGGFLAVQPPSGKEKQIELDMAYHGNVDVSSEDYVRPNQAALTGYWYPHTGRMPATSDVQITVPRGWAAIGQGEPTGKTVTATTSTFGWSNKMPICYITVAAGKYIVTSRKVGNILVSAYMLRGNAARAKKAIDTAAGALTWFSKNFSPFPYTRYAVVETDVFPAALECYSFTLAASSLIPMAIVHEVAHTWWGGVVPNTYTRTLWNESFAEYSDGLYSRQNDIIGLHEFNTKMMSQSGFVTRHNLLNSKDAMDLEESLLGYGKGSLVLENLERMLGTQKMLAAMQRFVANHKKDKAGEDAEWPDFVEAVTQTAGEEWRGFFPAWLNGTYLPSLRLTGVTTGQEGAKYTVAGAISQNEPAHWLQVPLVISTADGKTITQNVNVKSTAQSFQFTIDSKPTQVSLDPKTETLRAAPNKSTSASLLSFQTISTPLFIFYATGGSPDEADIAKEVAENQAKEVFPFAAITVKPDTEATYDLLTNTNILLVGRGENLKIPAPFRDQLPLHTGRDGLTLGARQWKEGDIWGMSVQNNPNNGKRLLGHITASNPAALRNFHYQADLDTFKGTFVIKGAGKPVVSEEARASDSTVVILNP